MLATLGGILALMVGLAWLLLPLLATEMSRPRDSVWGAVVLLLGLVLVTSAERLTGSPMLAVLCGALVIGRLGGEAVLGRWRQLEPEEKRRLGSAERWTTSLQQLAASLARLLQMGGGIVTGLGGWMGALRRPRTTTKRWVRPEPGDADTGAPSEATGAGSAVGVEAAADLRSGTAPSEAEGAEGAGSEVAEPIVVRDFGEIDTLIAEAVPEAEPAADEARQGEDPAQGASADAGIEAGEIPETAASPPAGAAIGAGGSAESSESGDPDVDGQDDGNRVDAMGDQAAAQPGPDSPDREAG
jgi:hypothetical protein